MKKVAFVLGTILFALCGLFQMTFTAKAEESKENKMILKKLAEPFSCSDIEKHVTIMKAASYIAKKTGIPIAILNHAELAEAGVTVDDQVQFGFPFQVSVKDALDYLVKQKKIAWVVKDDVLIITTKEKAKGELFTRAYYVGDLLETVYIDLPGMDENEKKNPLATAMGHRKLENSTFKSLMDYITTMVAPESWEEGKGGDIMEYYPNLSLVIRQTEDVHQQISELIANVRKINSIRFSFTFEVIPAKETEFTKNNRIMHGNSTAFCGREFDFTVFKEHCLENCLIQIAPRSSKPVANDLTSKNEPFVFPFQAGKTVKVKAVTGQQDGNDVIKMTLCVEGKEPETRTFYASPIIEEEMEYFTGAK